MKTVILIRFGIPTVLPKEAKLFDEICGEARMGIAGALGKFGIIGAVRTSLSPHEIAAKYEELADSTGDRMPVIVAYPEDLGLNFKDFGFDGFMQEFYKKCAEAGIEEQPKEEPIQACNMSLDELLDLVSAKGLKNLTPEESARLQELSK